MRSIVFEGPDNSGKSTLIEYLSPLFPDWIIRRSEGPEKEPGEINKRINTYITDATNSQYRVVFDRHPAVSDVIYSKLKGSLGPSNQSLHDFYATSPLFIYCRARPNMGMEGHTFNAGVDTTEHVQRVVNNYDYICRAYDQWALEHAHIIYRINGSSNPYDIANLIKGITHELR